MEIDWFSESVMQDEKRGNDLNHPLVSIITPCFNGEAYLDRYFSSVLQQTYQPLELIFINDGSTDRTAEIAENYRPRLEAKGIRFIYQAQENAGQAAALNRGLKLFTGEYLTWPDSDDEMTPDCIEKKVAYLQEHPEVQMVRSDGIYCNQSTGEKRRIAKVEDKSIQDIFAKLLVVTTYGCCGCYMISKRLFLDCYPERDIFESHTGQNWQMLVPAASRSLCGYLDEPLYIVNEHSDSHSRTMRSDEEMYQRWDMFKEILRHAVKVSECDKDDALRLVEENCARQQFYYAVSAGDKEKLDLTMAAIRRYGRLTVKECLLYLKCRLKG